MRSTLQMIAVATAVLAGCASGPRYTEVRPSMPALGDGKGRILFYRTANVFGSGIQPDVKLNGKVVGSAQPGGFFYMDVPADNYEVVLSTEVDKKLTFALGANEEKCVRLSVGLGVVVYRVYPEMATPETCEKEIPDTSFIGQAKGK
ncbi:MULTISPECIES: DUF2846 domain-containing protein [Methyloversatilis]|uniref:DUF2846 domain-containing protein n=1 Tax=Methyloversatilis TaxID=378210 RepID=UPI0003657319|nr:MULTISPECIES: DUF2846 domain-containing protein [Methyloversatilis]MBL8469576.1 DUF2846 domain-containing protein [Methyloversatilis discipulorum]